MTKKSNQLLVPGSSMEQYLAEVNRFPLLTREEEQELARRWNEDEDMNAAQQLVTANLRFVVKVAYEYKNYDVKLVDLVQEGNIGLMKAVRRFNPERGYRLISYAVWWIRAYMQNYILKNWSMVKIGATAKHRRMLFGRKEGPKEGEEVQEAFLIPAVSSLAGGDFVGTNANMAKRDFSLDAQMGDGGGGSYIDMLASPPEDLTDQMARNEMIEGVQVRLKGLLDGLNERQRFILENRLIADEPMTLQEIGNKYGISRERARQLEVALKKKLARSLQEFDPALEDEEEDVIDL
jgi:RNA polymerase sigma-32 factor